MKLRTALLTAVGSMGLAGAAQAAVITLDFDALDGAANEGPATYYAGGSGSAGTTGGPDYGISFSANTITGCSQPNSCANTNSALPPSNPNIIFFLSGGASTMDVAGGFTTGFSFYYAAPVTGGSINVWSGLDDTGTLLTTLSLPLTTDGATIAGCFGTDYCPFVPIGVTFAGTAMSVDFAGTDNFIGFDNITLGASVPTGAVPEPASWAMMLTGLGLVGNAMRKRRVVRTTLAYS
jgi:hypothetical protein